MGTSITLTRRLSKYARLIEPVAVADGSHEGQAILCELAAALHRANVSNRWIVNFENQGHTLYLENATSDSTNPLHSWETLRRITDAFFQLGKLTCLSVDADIHEVWN